MNEVKLCECGCGLPAPISPSTWAAMGYVKGQPRRFRKNHRKGVNQWAKMTLAERFWPRVNKDGPIPSHCPELGPCWVWTGGGDRYGNIRVDGRTRMTHQVAWLLETGTWPKLNVLHKCDNGFCVRFTHLFEGTHQDNMNDREAKGRGKAKGIPPMTCVHGVVGKRKCKVCHREYERERQRKKRLEALVALPDERQ